MFFSEVRSKPKAKRTAERIGGATFLLFALAGCQTKAPGPPPRYAVVRFENLSGDASLEWVARAASEVLSRSLAHALDGPVLHEAALTRAGAGGISEDRVKAELAGATRLVSGYIERVDGKVRLSATDEDLATHRTVRIVAAEAAQPLPAIQQLGHSFSAAATAGLTLNPEVLRLYATALDGPAESALPDLREATRIDPGFGPAWVGLVDATGRQGDRDATLAVTAEALKQKLDPYDNAAIRLQKAVLENDKPARNAAMRDLVAESPGDTPLLRTLAESETATGRFGQSASDWRKVTQASPAESEAWNQLGYALAWNGDLPGALGALKEYAARWPGDPNALDSTGDVYYMYGKFAEAATWYLKANDKNPQFLNGGALDKAAWALYRAGDKVKAGSTFERFRAVREKSGAAGFAWFAADWLYRTGREKEAVTSLRKAAETAPPAAASGLWSQLVVWDLMAKDREMAVKDAAIDATKPPSNMSAIARFAALPSVPAAEWQKRSEAMLRGPGIDSARRLALGVALLLDGRKQDAIPIWDKIAADAPGTDFFSRTVDAKLKGEKPRFEIVPDSLAVNELLALPDKL